MDDLKLYAASTDQLDSLIHSVRILSQDIRMSFGLDKCAVLAMRRGRQQHSSGIELLDGTSMREVADVGYKCLGILQLDQTLNAKMKAKNWEEYIRRVKKLCRSKLSGENLIMGNNSWAVAVVRYGAGIVEWTKEELANLDRKTQKIMSMNGGLHTRSNVARPYLPSVAECVKKESKSLHGYLTDGQEWMLKAAWEERVIVDTTEPLEDYKKRVYEEKVRDGKDKPLHGVFVRDTKEIAGEESWKWLHNGHLKKETEGLICAAQEQALRSNSVKCHIDKTNDSFM